MTLCDEYPIHFTCDLSLLNCKDCQKYQSGNIAASQRSYRLDCHSQQNMLLHFSEMSVHKKKLCGMVV